MAEVSDCAYCGMLAVPPHMDHVVPISRGGPDDPRNKVLACGRCNLSKGARLPSEWLPNPPKLVSEIESRMVIFLKDRDPRIRRTRPRRKEFSFPCEGCGYAISWRPGNHGQAHHNDHASVGTAIAAVNLIWIANDEDLFFATYSTCGQCAPRIVYRHAGCRWFRCSAGYTEELSNHLRCENWTDEASAKANRYLHELENFIEFHTEDGELAVAERIAANE